MGLGHVPGRGRTPTIISIFNRGFISHKKLLPYNQSSLPKDLGPPKEDGDSGLQF
jgi:hypothetical protein